MFRGLSVRLRVISRVAMVFLAAFLFSGVPAFASIALDATSTQTAPAGATSLSWNHVLGSGGNRIVVCGVTFGYNDTAQASPLSPAPTMTFDGVAMTSAIQAPTHAQSSTAKIFSQIFYISDAGLGARAGTYTIALTIPTAVSGGASAGCTSLFGVNQSAPEATNTEYSGSSTPAPSITLTTITAGDWVIDALAGGYGSSGSAGSPGSSQTLLYNVQSTAGSKTTGGSNGGELSAGSYELVATPGPVTVGWTPTVARQAYAAAAFAPAATVNYTVSTAANPVGSGTVTLNPNQASYPAGTSVQVTANPGIGYTFSNFSGNLTGSTNPATLIVNGNESVTANFTPTPCTLTINIVGSGTVTPASGSSYTCGTQVQVTATPGSGYSFGQFSGALAGSTNPQTITLNTNSTVTATFVQGTSCNLSTSVTGSGSITVIPSGTVFTCGTQLTFTAVPATYFSLTGFGGALSGTTNPQTLTLNSDSTVSATFAQTSYPINITNVGPGTVVANPADTGNGYAPGTVVQLTATPNSGSLFTGFSGDLTGATNPQSLTVNATRNVTATFTASTITKDAVSHAASTATTGVLSWQHTLGAGGSRAVVIAVGQTDTLASPDPSSVVTSVLFNGVYATPVPNSIISGGTSGSVQTQLFYLLESELPPAGTYTVTVNLAGSVAGVQAGAVSFIGVNQGPPEAVVATRNTSGADLISATITTLTNNAVVVDMVEDNNVAALTANTGQTVAWTGSATSGTGGSSTKAIPTAGPTTLGWAGSASRLAYSLAAFPPATATVPATYTLTTSVAGGLGAVTTNPGLSSYPLSTGVLLTATAQTGYAFSSWSGDYTSTANPLPITMDTNRNVVANFVTAATCNLTINVIGSGTVAPSAGTYNCGTVIHFVATPSAGYNFTSYSGDFSSVDNPADFTISADSTVTVEFDAIPVCSLTVTNVGQGSVSPGTGNYACGSVLNLQATAAGGYAFSG
jgi:Divergent InlB B-repeat domain